MKRLLSILSALLLCLALCACGRAAAPEPAPTLEPTPEPTPAPTEYTITDESAEEILALAEIPSLRRIDAEGCREYEALLALREALPDCEIRWAVEVQGQKYPSDTRELKLSSLEGAEEALRALPELETLDLLEAGAELADLDRLSAIRPDVFYLWEFPFRGFTIRTDIECYSTLQDIGFTRADDEAFYPLLKYCKHLKALDLGHNGITDVSMIGEMKDMEVLILADNPIVDASPLGKLKKLVYLELFLCHDIQDFSFLNELTELTDLNLCYDENCTSMDFLEHMPKMRFLLVKYAGISQSEFNRWAERLPEVEMVYWDGDRESCNSGWRDTHRNYQIRFCFSNWPNLVSFTHYDDALFNFDGYELNIGDY